MFTTKYHKGSKPKGKSKGKRRTQKFAEGGLVVPDRPDFTDVTDKMKYERARNDYNEGLEGTRFLDNDGSRIPSRLKAARDDMLEYSKERRRARSGPRTK
jgi:hypothetical protein